MWSGVGGGRDETFRERQLPLCNAFRSPNCAARYSAVCLWQARDEGGLEQAESAGRRTALTRTGSRMSRSSGKGGRAAAAAATAADEDSTPGAESDDGAGPNLAVMLITTYLCCIRTTKQKAV